MKRKEKPWALTKEGPAREAKKNHEDPKAQKEGKGKKKSFKKKEDIDLGHEQDLHHQGSGSFERKPRRS